MRPRGLVILIAFVLLGLARPAGAFFFDHSVYDNILSHYVDEEGYVDYDDIRLNSLTALESYFERLAGADLAGWPAPERISFWINAYNARIIYEIAQKPDLKKISQDWTILERPFKVAGRMLSPVDIKKLLRQEKDPRILSALSNGTLNGPKIRNKAYTPDNLDVLLQINAPIDAGEPERDWTINSVEYKPGRHQDHAGPAADEIPPDALSTTHPGLGQDGK